MIVLTSSTKKISKVSQDMRPPVSRQKISIKTWRGNFLLEMTERGLYAVRFSSRYPRILKRGQAVKLCLSPLFNKLRNAMLDLSGYTPFQCKVYAALRKVPAGKVITYGELARRAGYPGAARAVGTAMNKNRLAIVIPCHRVIPAGGGLGEYSAGKKWKRWLLEHEESIRATRKAQRKSFFVER
jgi:O-6-methylguanine DNA methyltransferase